jgi:hypothetical protein
MRWVNDLASLLGTTRPPEYKLHSVFRRCQCTFQCRCMAPLGVKPTFPSQKRYFFKNRGIEPGIPVNFSRIAESNPESQSKGRDIRAGGDPLGDPQRGPGCGAATSKARSRTGRAHGLHPARGCNGSLIAVVFGSHFLRCAA